MEQSRKSVPFRFSRSTFMLQETVSPFPLPKVINHFPYSVGSPIWLFPLAFLVISILSARYTCHINYLISVHYCCNIK